MSRLIGFPAVAAALSLIFVMLIFVEPAGAATAASRAPICMKVTNTYINGGFLNQKFPAWLFTNHCNYVESFYVEFPGTRVWAPSIKFNPYQSLGFISNGQPASLVRILECPAGWSAAGGNPNVCYR
jgi:hypothetical protein